MIGAPARGIDTFWVRDETSRIPESLILRWFSLTLHEKTYKIVMFRLFQINFRIDVGVSILLVRRSDRFHG